MSALRITGGKPLRGRVCVPADLEVAQAALLMAAIADGVSELEPLPAGSDADAFLQVLRALGVPVQTGELLRIDGVGLDGLRMPAGALDCGSAWLGMSLCAGLLCGQKFGTRITVHASLATKSLDPLIGPLRARGGHIAGRESSGGHVPPLAVAPLVEGEHLQGLDCSLTSAEPAAKSGVLVSGLFASGPTTIAEPFVSADHLERLFVGLGLPLRRIGSVIGFDRGSWDGIVPVQHARTLPGSATIAGYLATIAQLVPGSAIQLENAGINPTRSGLLDVLRSWGADLAIHPAGDASLREPVGEVQLSGRGLRGGVLGAEELVRSQRELPALAMLGAASRRGVRLFDLPAIAPAEAAEWQELIALLRAFGRRVDLSDECVTVTPDGAACAATYDVRDDATVAIAAVALALASPGESVLEHAEPALARTYPGFIEAARRLGAEIQSA